MNLTSDRSFAEEVYRVVDRIPYGRVVSYGDVAVLTGRPRAARGVGAALKALPEGSRIPWWRVVSSSGAIAIPHMGGNLQEMLLRQEGVPLRGHRVEMRRFRWAPEQPSNAAAD